MNISDKYEDRISELKAEKERLLKKKNRYTIIRLALVIAGLIVSYQLGLVSMGFGWLSFAVFFSAFLWVVRTDNKNDAEIKKRDELYEIYKNELKGMKQDNLFGKGSEFHDPQHAYSYDLDIFGPFSLFNYLNRTVTATGSEVLATWLKEASDVDEIKGRQKAAKELSLKTEFKEAFLRTVFLGEKSKEESGRFLRWANSFKISLTNHKTLKLLSIILPILAITTLIFSIISPGLWPLFILIILINYAVLSQHSQKVQLIHDHINNQSEEFLKYGKLIHLISNESFKEDIPVRLKEKLLKYHNAEGELKKLSGLTRTLNNRSNALISIPVNLLTFWEIHTAVLVEKWFSKNAGYIEDWLTLIGRFDALLSIGISHYNHPSWTFPDISTEYFSLRAKEIGHPLLPAGQRVNNDYNVSGNNQMDIITGSNMAGKSTFLRTLGVNTVLALAGAPVCAKSMQVSPARVMTYMRVQDSLEENASSFYAELKRIRRILKNVEENKNCFLLLDEILKGTNSKDRHTGSVALIKQLLKNKVVGLISTHDLQLTEIAEELPSSIRNFHFDVNVENEELFFDYKLKEGICQSFNASLLMKKIGIDIDSLS